MEHLQLVSTLLCSSGCVVSLELLVSCYGGIAWCLGSFQFSFFDIYGFYGHGHCINLEI